jgi:hypothetical protein
MKALDFINRRQNEYKQEHDSLVSAFRHKYPNLKPLESFEYNHSSGHSEFMNQLTREIRRLFDEQFPEHAKKIILHIYYSQFSCGISITNETLEDHMNNYCMDLFYLYHTRNIFYCIVPELKSFFLEQNMKEESFKRFMNEHVLNFAEVVESLKR